MEEKIKHIKFKQKVEPNFFFEILPIEELLNRKLDHDIYKNHLVEFYVILFVLEGEGYHSIDFSDYKYQKGTVLLIRQDQIHKFSRNANLKGYLLVFTDEFIISYLNEVETLKTFQLFNELLNFPKIELKIEEKEFSNFVSLVNQIKSEYDFKDNHSIAITRSILHIIITNLFRNRIKNGHFFGEKKYLEEFLAFQEMVEKNCFSSKKVNHYAKNMGCSTKTLNNIVQAVVNKPAKAFINEIAITQIKRLLISTNKPIKEIAYTTGFDDTANFFKYFKKNVGSSPETFRKMFQ